MRISARRRTVTVAALSCFLCPAIAVANDQPLEIIQKMYRNLLAHNFNDAINSKKNRARYFVPALARLYDADEVQACVSGIEATGQELNYAQIRKTLSIVQTSNNGVRAEVESRVGNGGPPERFRYEFVKQGNAWKISDVIFPNGDRFSHTDCGIGQREDHQPRPLAASSKPTTAAPAADILPLKHGFYVAVGVPCKEASFADLSSYAGGNVLGAGHYSCTLKLMNKTGGKYNVSSKCISERDDDTIKMTEVYTITSATSFTVKNKNGVFYSRHCERSSLPSPWGGE